MTHGLPLSLERCGFLSVQAAILQRLVTNIQAIPACSGNGYQDREHVYP